LGVLQQGALKKAQPEVLLEALQDDDVLPIHRIGGLAPLTLLLHREAGEHPPHLRDLRVPTLAIRHLHIGTLACRQSACYRLYHMVKYSQAGLDASFAALSDATRRGVLEQLGRSDASITDLAEKFHMTLAGMMKHVGVLEQAELVTTEKVGRVRTCRL